MIQFSSFASKNEKCWNPENPVLISDSQNIRIRKYFHWVSDLITEIWCNCLCQYSIFGIQSLRDVQVGDSFIDCGWSIVNCSFLSLVNNGYPSVPKSLLWQWHWTCDSTIPNPGKYTGSLFKQTEEVSNYKYYQWYVRRS